MTFRLVQPYIPEVLFGYISGYLHCMMLSRQYIYSYVPNQMLFPECVSTYPQNYVIVQKRVVTSIPLAEVASKRPNSFFRLCRDFLLCVVAMHRAALDPPNFGVNYLLVDYYGCLLFDVLPDDFVDYFSQQSTSDMSISLHPLISDVFFHYSKVISVSPIVEVLNSLTYLFFYYKMIDQIVPWFQNAASASQLLSVVIYLEDVVVGYKSDYLSINFARDVFHPFNVLFHELESEVALFIKGEGFYSLVYHVYLNTLMSQEAQYAVSRAVRESFRLFLGYELKGQSSRLILSTDQVLYETPIEPKVIRIRYSRYQQRWVVRLVEKYFQSTFSDLYIVLKLYSTEQVVDYICDLVYSYSELTIFTKTSNLHSIMEVYLLQSDSKDGNEARRLSTKQDPEQTEIQAYQLLLARCEADYIKAMHNSALYLGQIFPRILDVFNLYPDPDLDQFDCMEGGRFLLILLDRLIRPDLKILYIFDEVFFTENAYTDLNDNILISVLLNYNYKNSYNSTLLHFYQLEEYYKDDEKYRFEVLRKILKQAKIMSFEHVLSEKVLTDDFYALMINISGKKQNAYDILTAANCLVQQYCCPENYLCKYSQLYEYIRRSGMYYANIELGMEQCGSYLCKFPEAETLFARASKAVQKLIGTSIDYFGMVQPCFKQRAIYFRNMQAKFGYELYLDILFIFAVACQTMELEQLANITNAIPSELHSACENLCAMHFLRKVEHNAYCIAGLDVVEYVIKQFNGYNYQYQLDKLFWANITQYYIAESDELYQCKLFSYLPRQYYCIVQTYQSNYFMRRNSVVVHQSSFYQLDDISFSLITKLDDILSLSQNTTYSDSTSEDSEEFYAQYGIFKPHIEGKDDETGALGISKEVQYKQRQITTQLVKIKTCLLFVGCLNVHSRRHVDDALLYYMYLQDNSYQISCILSTTAHYIHEVKQICGVQPYYQQYLQIANTLETSCIIYYFINVSTKYSMILMNELTKRTLSNCSKAMIGWKMLKYGEIYETNNYILVQLASYINFYELDLLVTLFAEFPQSETKFDSMLYIINILNIYDDNRAPAPLASKHSFFLLAEVLLVANRLLCNESLLLGLSLKLLYISVQNRVKCAVLDACYLLLLDWVIYQAVPRDAILAQSLYLRYREKATRIANTRVDRSLGFLQNHHIIKYVCMNGHKDLDGVTAMLLYSYPVALAFDYLFHYQKLEFLSNELPAYYLKATDFDYNKHIVIRLLGGYFVESLNTDKVLNFSRIQHCIELLIRLSDSSQEANIYSILSQIVSAFDSREHTHCAIPCTVVIGHQRQEVYAVFSGVMQYWRKSGRKLDAFLIIAYFYKPYCVFHRRTSALRELHVDFMEISVQVPKLKYEPLFLIEDYEELQRRLVGNGMFDGIYGNEDIAQMFNACRLESKELYARTVRVRDVCPKEFEQFIYYWAI